MTERAPIADAELMADLDAIADEVKRRKKANPFQPYAMWAMLARQDAIIRHAQRSEATEPIR